MIASIAITDPTTALMLTHFEVGTDGRVTTRVRGARQRRRFQRHAALRRLFA